MDTRYVVRYGSTRLIGEFGNKGRDDLPRGAAVAVRTDRGVEAGEVLSIGSERTRELLGGTAGKGTILRELSEQDRQKLDDLRLQEREAFRGGNELIAQHKLAMQLVDVEQLLGGERLIFYYLSENRIDFRELVKSLAARFKIRIEMRQIGVRDEAKLLADYGDCGKPVCCNTHLREMPPVSMKMAKLQKATLDPTKISGRCGRLKCCLRYEYDTYEEYRRELPHVGALIVTRQGQGKVIGQEILARKVLVLYNDNRQILADLADVLTVVSKGKKSADAPRDDEHE
ncbi:MAG: stage 0 sporulation family protein [Planctomycetales bacterium]